MTYSFRDKTPYPATMLAPARPPYRCRYRARIKASGGTHRRELVAARREVHRGVHIAQRTKFYDILKRMLEARK